MILTELESIKFKNRPWLFFIFVPLIFSLFIINFCLYFILKSHVEKFWFFMTFLFFIIQLLFIQYQVAKFRYVSNGKFQFDENGISIKGGKSEFKINWDGIVNFKLFYRGDRFWEIKLFKYTIHTKDSRYRNLRWNFKKILDEQMLDCVEINNRRYYVKIRNQEEKQIFMNLLSYAKQRVKNVNLIQTP